MMVTTKTRRTARSTPSHYPPSVHVRAGQAFKAGFFGMVGAWAAGVVLTVVTWFVLGAAVTALLTAFYEVAARGG